MNYGLTVFNTKSYIKAKFKYQKVATDLSDVVAKVNALCDNLDAINDEFTKFNNNVGSSEWSKDAADISGIIDNIKDSFSTICQNIVTDISDINTAIGMSNSKLAGKITENQAKFSAISNEMQNIK